MKKLVLLSVAATLTCSMSFAKIWRVNNNTGVTADFTTAQAANDNVNVLNGDTIHLEPSITNYGSVNCTKRLVWISTGAFLDLYPNEQYSQNIGKLTSVSAYLPSCSSSVFHIYATGSIDINAPNIKVDRSYASGVSIQNYGYGATTGIVIINSFITGVLTINNGNSVVVTNNIFGSYPSVGTGATSAVITHNVFNALVGGSGTINNSILENNIFNKTTALTFNNSTVQYNMSASNFLQAGNGNQNSVAMSTVFVNANGTTDGDFVLKTGSPAIGTGSSGVNLGAYGGASPFKIALQPAIPAIYKIQAPAAPAGNTLSVTFSTKSNN